MTAGQVAKELIREKVERGESLAEIQSSQMGRIRPKEWCASIGGWHNGRVVASDKIIVWQVNGVECDILFDLENIYNSVKIEVENTPLF